MESSIYFNKDSYIVKIPVKKGPLPSLLDKFSTAIDEIVDLFVPDEPPMFVSTRNEETEDKKEPKYEFLYDQNFRGISIKVAIVLNGRLIGVQHKDTRKLQWFIKNPNVNEIQYQLVCDTHLCLQENQIAGTP